MRKALYLVISVVLLFSFAAVAQEGANVNDKTKVLINSNTIDPDGFKTNGRLKVLNKEAKKEGFTLQSESLWDVTDEILEDVDIFYLGIPGFKLLDDDKAALRRFLKRGGGLLVAGWYGGVINAPIATIDNKNVESFIKDYGIRYGASVYTVYQITANIHQDSPIAGPDECEILQAGKGRTWLVIDDKKKAEEVATTDNDDLLVALSKHKNLGLGRLVVVGDYQVFTDNLIEDQDNIAFALNTLKYLRGGCDLKVLACKVKGKNKLTLIAKVKNFGNLPSAATKVDFIMTDDGTIAGPPAAVKTIASVDLAALDPNKKKKVKIKIDPPTGVDAGEYMVVVVVDAKEDTDDTDRSNNTKVAKGKITIN